MSSFNTNFEKVGEFHLVFGHPMKTEPQTNVFEEDPKLVEFRLSQVEEELNELKDAISNDDFVECLDAICDLMYFVYGTFHVFGVNFDEQPKQKIRTFDSPKNYTDLFKNDLSGLTRQVSMLEQHFSCLQTSCEEKDFEMTVSYLSKLEAQCHSLGNFFGVDIDVCFSEVHRSNMTKVCLTEEVAQETVESYLKTKQMRDIELESATTDEEKKTINDKYKVYSEPSYRKSETTIYWVVYDKATSKILKSVKFELPKLAEVIDLNNIKNGKNDNNQEQNNLSDENNNLSDTESEKEKTLVAN